LVRPRGRALDRGEGCIKRHKSPASSNNLSSKCSSHRILASSQTSVSSSNSFSLRTSGRDSYHMRIPRWEEDTGTFLHPHTTLEDTLKGLPMHRLAGPRINHRCSHLQWDGTNTMRSHHPWDKISPVLVDETMRQWISMTQLHLSEVRRIKDASDPRGRRKSGARTNLHDKQGPHDRSRRLQGLRVLSLRYAKDRSDDQRPTLEGTPHRRRRVKGRHGRPIRTSWSRSRKNGRSN
jgi:hypothetical protein